MHTDNLNFCKCGCNLKCLKEYRTGHLPIEICECGCNQLTGPGRKFISGHNRKGKGVVKNIQLCNCGCKKFANPGRKFIFGHQCRGKSTWNKGMTKIGNPEILKFGGVEKGHLASNEAKKNMSAAHIGHKMAEEVRVKLIIIRTGMKQTEKSKQKQRCTLKKLYKEHGDEIVAKRLSSGGGHRKFPYICVDGKIVKMRSSWEILYAKYLDSQNIVWLYEPIQFKLSNGKRYWPDFYLPELNEYHEIKGWMPLSSVEKMDLFQKEYPKFGFKLIMQNDLIHLGILKG